ncbi:MAG: pirin family protein [Gemmataceae bacterium]
MKKVLSIQRAGRGHWVGDGFPVRTIFSHHSHGSAVSPFLLLDYAGPAEFPPSDKPRGVEEHPHKGFETVTIVYSGEVEHRDSSGGGGVIGPGDVQWMTAASGLVHEEMHGHDFTRRGGVLEMIQLWVNLPARDKAVKPHYQSIASTQIPQVPLPGEAGTVRVIAGDFGATRGPASTYTPINLWDVRLLAGHRAELHVPKGHTALLFVLSGRVDLADGQVLEDAGLAVFDRAGDSISLTAAKDTKLVLLSGEPIDEPVVAHGPFVMNTEAEIRQAFLDFQAGRMGQLVS